MFKPFDQHLSCGHVCRKRYPVYVGEPHQCGDIRLMRLRGQWVPEKKHQVHLLFCNLCPDLLIAAERPGLVLFDVQAYFLLQSPTGRSGC